MTETAWNHMGIIFIVLAPLFVFWLDLRNRQANQHVENRERLVKIETTLEPIAEWWNDIKRNGH